MMIVNHFGVLVRDMDRMLEFYQKGFGFEIARIISTGEAAEPVSQFSSSEVKSKGHRRPRVVMLRAGNCYLEVMENLASKTPATQPAGYIQMCIEVKDLETEFHRLKDLGIAFVQSGPIDLGYVKAMTGLDPEGNQIELVETKADYIASTDRIIEAVANRHTSLLSGGRH
jgi:predicted enzyme related to lactoylglutathione lyase